MSGPDILCMGEAMVEFVRTGEDAGHAIYRQGTCGDTSNTAIAAARQGASVGYVSAVGADDFGAALLACWLAEGVDTSGVIRSETNPTGIYFVDPQPEARRFTYYRAGSAASRMQPGQLDKTLVAQARILHLSGISLAISDSARETCLAAIQVARDNGVLVTFDINHRPQLWSDAMACATIEKLLPMVDIFFPSLDEAEALTGIKSADAVLDHFAGLGAARQCLKMGEHGCRLAWDGDQFDQPAFATQPLDSTGAGDAFAGAFLARYLETQNSREAALYGCATAALTVAGYGAVSPLPDRQQVEALIREQARETTFQKSRRG